MKFLRIVLLCIIVAIALLPTVVAAIDCPTAASMVVVDASMYRHCLEDNDLLLLVHYDIDYSSVPDESITEAYLGRTLVSSIEIGSTEPYYYYNKGYDHGVWSIYWSASDTDKPVWSSTPSVRFEGNPTLGWTCDVPSVGTTTINWVETATQGDTSTRLGADIIAYATEFDGYWGVTLTQDSLGSTILNTAGQVYFAGAITNLRTICPQIFASSVTKVDYTPKDHSMSYRDTLMGRWEGTGIREGFENIADWFGLPYEWLTGIIWLFVTFIIAYFAGLAVDDLRPALFLALPSIILGNLIGFLSLTFTLIAALICAIGIAYVFIYARAP